MNALEQFVQANFLDSDSLSLINKYVKHGYETKYTYRCIKKYWVEFTTPERKKYRIEVHYPEYSSNPHPLTVSIHRVQYIPRPIVNDGHTYMARVKSWKRIYDFRASEVSFGCIELLRQVTESRLYPF